MDGYHNTDYSDYTHDSHYDDAYSTDHYSTDDHYCENCTDYIDVHPDDYYGGSGYEDVHVDDGHDDVYDHVDDTYNCDYGNCTDPTHDHDYHVDEVVVDDHYPEYTDEHFEYDANHVCNESCYETDGGDHHAVDEYDYHHEPTEEECTLYDHSSCSHDVYDDGHTYDSHDVYADFDGHYDDYITEEEMDTYYEDHHYTDEKVVYIGIPGP